MHRIPSAPSQRVPKLASAPPSYTDFSPPPYPVSESGETTSPIVELRVKGKTIVYEVVVEGPGLDIDGASAILFPEQGHYEKKAPKIKGHIQDLIKAYEELPIDQRKALESFGPDSHRFDANNPRDYLKALHLDMAEDNGLQDRNLVYQSIDRTVLDNLSSAIKTLPPISGEFHFAKFKSDMMLDPEIREHIPVGAVMAFGTGIMRAFTTSDGHRHFFLHEGVRKMSDYADTQRNIVLCHITTLEHDSAAIPLVDELEDLKGLNDIKMVLLRPNTPFRVTATARATVLPVDGEKPDRNWLDRTALWLAQESGEVSFPPF